MSRKDNNPMLNRLTAIITDVAAEHRVTPEMVTGKYRGGQLPGIRHFAMHCIREATGASLPEIGRAFSKRDHSSVLYGIRESQKRCAADRQTANMLARIVSRYKAAALKGVVDIPEVDA